MSKAILSRLSDGASVLDIGCGNGLLYEDMKKMFNLDKDAWQIHKLA